MNRHGGEQQQQLALDEAFVRNLIRQTRADGFGSNHGSWTDQCKIGALAVAIASGGRVLASLNVIYPEQAVSPADAVRRFLPELRRAADEIADALSAQTPARDASGC